MRWENLARFWTPYKPIYSNSFNDMHLMMVYSNVMHHPEFKGRAETLLTNIVNFVDGEREVLKEL